MTFVFHHGWGFDAAFWDRLRATLGGEGVVAERGYFGPARAAAVPAGAVLVGHSLGALFALEQAMQARAAVAINGFDRFTAAPGFPGVPGRVLATMRRRMTDDPAATAAAFRARCGEATPLPGEPTARLADDLDALAQADARGASLAAPLLVLQGDADPILSPAHRAACFAGVRRITRAGGGHLLPLTDAAWCAGQIRALLG